ncbi:MAG: hypothetical protein ACRYF3_06025 [Janthinobacterium lividum]
MTSSLLVVGPAQHGVTAAALEQARVPGAGRVVRHEHLGPLEEVVATLPDGPVHVHVTDRLFGVTPAAAGEFCVGLARVRPLVVTLHDLPQSSDGALNHPRRSAAYAQIANAAAAVVLASAHERRLLLACVADRLGAGTAAEVDARTHVIPLPVPEFPPAPVARHDAPLCGAAVLGFLYPGKGHAAVLDALTGLPAEIGLDAFGRASDGHEDLVEALTRQAATSGRVFAVTGFLPEAHLLQRLRSPVVPVAPHEHLSASGSINYWIGAGRRPLVPRSDYTAELLARNPGAVRVYDRLALALRDALADPSSTWLPPGYRAGPSLAQTVSAVRAVVAEVSS